MEARRSKILRPRFSETARLKLIFGGTKTERKEKKNKPRERSFSGGMMLDRSSSEKSVMERKEKQKEEGREKSGKNEMNPPKPGFTLLMGKVLGNLQNMPPTF